MRHHSNSDRFVFSNCCMSREKQHKFQCVYFTVSSNTKKEYSSYKYNKYFVRLDLCRFYLIQLKCGIRGNGIDGTKSIKRFSSPFLVKN